MRRKKYPPIAVKLTRETITITEVALLASSDMRSKTPLDANDTDNVLVAKFVKPYFAVQ